MFKIAFKNIKNYGAYNFILIIIYEITNLLLLKKFDLFYDESKTNSYKEVRENSKKFNGPYLPTPYYILSIINQEIKKRNFTDHVFIDFGCGACRVINYFNDYFKKLIGIDINANFKNKLISKKQSFINLDLRKIKKLKKIINKEKYVLYFYEPFDLNLTTSIIKLFKNNECLIITVNVTKILNKKLKIIFSKHFRSIHKNVIIYKNLN
jgi:hypothetical protein